MYKRIIMVVACALFSLLAMLAVIITDLYDRDYPQSIDVENRLSLDFSKSNLSINEGFETLTKLDARWGTGLVKTAPDLVDENNKNIFASLNNVDLPDAFTWFNGNDEGEIVGKDRLANSYPDGSYLLTGETEYLSDLEDTLESVGVEVYREEASIFECLKFVMYERGFATAVLASFALIVTLALFWLSLKAQSRALHVLAGSPTTRIQIQDLSGFVSLLLISAIIVTMGATGYVGVFHGWIYVNTFLWVLVSLEVAVIAVSLVASLIMSAFAWPTATMIATRQPTVKSLRSAAIVIQSITFILVVAAAGPAWSTYKYASVQATEMEQWKQLSNQVGIEFATDIGEMVDLESQMGELIKDAETHDQAALSYTFTEEMGAKDDYGAYTAISFVNNQWLDLMTKDVPAPFFEAVSHQTVPNDLIDLVQIHLEIWKREGSSEKPLEKLQLLQPVDGFHMPVSGGAGGQQLYFADDTLLVVVPSIYNTFNDSDLTSLVSGNQIVFNGVPPTQHLLERHDLDVKALRNQGIGGELNIVYIAEEGMLRAQYMSYLAWLQNLSLLTLIIAFTIAVAISALIIARLHAKRDFPLRLAGQSWLSIIQVRVGREFLVGLGLVGVVYLFQRADEIGPILVVATYGLLIVPICHLFAVRWCFNGVSNRRF